MPSPDPANDAPLAHIPVAVHQWVSLWLNPKLECYKDPWESLMLDCDEVRVHWPYIHDLIAKAYPVPSEAYSHTFVDTPYWRVVASEVKRRAKHTCQKCGRNRFGNMSSTQGLQCHHTTYHHHGSEHLFLEDLQALCVVCHDLEHDKVIPAILQSRQWSADRIQSRWYMTLEEKGFRQRRAEKTETTEPESESIRAEARRLRLRSNPRA